MKRGIRLGLVAPILLLMCGSIACGETSNDDPNPGGGATAGASPSVGGATADTSCPAQTPTHGAPCQGALSCNYQAFLGCYPSPVLATCEQGRWDVSEPTPYTGPCPGDPIDGPGGCPATLPTAELGCGMTLDGPPRMFVCEYADAACVGGKRVATCSGQWQITPCEPASAGGAGGAGAGGEGSGGETAGGVPSAGGAE